MSDFERRLSDEITSMMGPVRPVDDLAVVDAVIATDRSRRRGFTMFSSLRFVAAGVVVALFGGLLLTGLPTSQRGGEMVPAAVTSSPDPAEPGYAAITGTFAAGSLVADAEITTSPAVPQESGTGMAYRSFLHTNDPRLSGWVESVQNYYGFLPGATSGTVRSSVGRLTNDGGSWLVVGEGFSQPGSNLYSSIYWVNHYTGEAGYEGLSAMTVGLPTGIGSWDVEGVLYPGEMPPTPELIKLPSE